MREGVGKFVEWGERFATDQRCREKIEEAMMSWLVQRARAHGVTHSDATLHEIFGGDVVLNTQGIEFWLDRGR